MNPTKITFLLAYLDALTKLTTNEYRCNTEINECIGWLREEFAESPDNMTVEVKHEANGTFYRMVTPNE